ncbi:MAG: glycosyltransferase [Bradyrhizobium sp.]|nr:glycosyltransferase [Bradyrhizobium sp.]
MSGLATHPAPAISVLLPVYNAAPYLRAALESILSQTFSDFELLALNDGSTDASLSILQQAAATDQRLRVISRENKGLVETLNELVGLSRGQLLARMDADDISRPERFERQVAYLNEHPECVAVGTRCLLIDPEGLPIMRSVNDLQHEDIERAMLSGWGAIRGICHPTLMMRRDAVMTAGGYSAEYTHAEDIDLFLRLGEQGRLANIADILLEYRQHFGSVGYSQSQRQMHATIKAVEAAMHRRGMEIDSKDIAVSIWQPMSRAAVHCKWAWWALYSGFRNTARKHALRGFLSEPHKLDSIKVLACAIRGY